MVKSMTSFGRASNDEGSKHLFSVEMKSVNSRYLDVNVRLPKSIISLEEEIRKLVNSKLSRGKVDIFINQKSYSKGEGVAKLNLGLAQSYYNCLKEIEEKIGVKNDITATQIARFPDVIDIVEEEDSIEEIWALIKPLIISSLDMMDNMRVVEGEKLKEDILYKLDEIESIVKSIEEIADVIPNTYKKKLEIRLKELLEMVDIDENRIAQEVAIISDKAAVDEEITRLKSHLNQIRITFNEGGQIGRKLDFIIQEMNREANTIASKSSDMDMTNYVINIKNLIEKIREQVQNIE
ncbi:YicC/YloC family endoribonuclease [Clostridium sp. AL.422]|uniref:YicC/YloC family endoribonuclease n=1 Tax=Clostridium TaxID=1485 RepID=UPI00293DFD08|nr:MULTISPECIES: YicC/YloC family endoribonuclease [unclassified Clostridium]MDV4151228.1 YicC/YloC family endoribonuclease [Clostridium sp. AL.422]